MKNCWLITGASLWAAASCTGHREAGLQEPEPVEDAQPRNIIFILSDDHRYDFMGFTGKVPWLETPNMDRLALNGAHLRNAFVTTSLSSPSRASILTGLYSHTHKVVDNQAPLPGNLIFFPQYLQQAGYETAFFGKWHMGNTDDRPQPGFDHWESFRGQGVYYNPTLNINGKRTQYSDSTYITDLLTDHAIQWLEGRKGNQPFFLYLSHKAVHSEFIPARRHRGMYAGKEIIYPPSYHIPEYEITTPPTLDPETGKAAEGKDFYGERRLPDWLKHQRESWHGVDYMYHGATGFEKFFVDYCETLMAVDESIGRVMEYLKENDLLNSTLIVYMGDNGFSFGEHGLIDKRQFYEESARVPLLAHCPDLIKKNTEVNQLVQNTDIAPTLLEAAGLNPPEYMQGASFLPLLEGKETAWRDKIFYEYYWEFHFPQTPTMHGVRSERYKYIRYHGIWDTNEFYDLAEDPFETNNLIDSPEHQNIIQEFLDDLYTWLEETNGMQIPLKRTMGTHIDHRNAGTY
ncbi:MAG TPA: DUF4976 domain-containing protein [Bacteroidetes bacterium]|nr:DUF4976 domain-containing protein [Bacteroidota bacterium]